MAIDVYLQIDGIKGESQDDRHKDWIEITSAQWGVIQPKSATASTAGGHTAERCELRSVTSAAGKTLPKARLEVFRGAGGNTSGGWDLATNRIA